MKNPKPVSGPMDCFVHEAVTSSVVSLGDLGETFDEVSRRVETGGERIEIRKNGRAIAALVPLSDLKALEALEDRLDALDPPEIEAIERGEALREQIEKHLATLPLAPPDVGAADALEMLAWMVARGHLDVKVAVPCDSGGKPVHDSAIFHEKTGIVEDRAGDRIAWTGSLNETAAGWQRNSSAARWSTTTCRGTRCGSSSVSGRIDRLGQTHPSLCIVNLHYEGTVETDVYRALRERIGLFETVVGRLQPILAQLPGTISDAVLSGGDRESADRANVVDEIERRTREAEARGFDIDAVIDEDLTVPVREPSPVVMDDLDRVIGMSDLMPAGTDIQPLGHREYGLLAPDMTERLRVTTDPAYFEDHAESVELWSPGSPLFRASEFLAPVED